MIPAIKQQKAAVMSLSTVDERQAMIEGLGAEDNEVKLTSRHLTSGVV